MKIPFVRVKWHGDKGPREVLVPLDRIIGVVLGVGDENDSITASGFGQELIPFVKGDFYKSTCLVEVWRNKEERDDEQD